mmetsp:Transcript_24026/g.36964  ORF Transcript_24026/g.36964 Transcript_24026/m.36964 type:complete len:184 (+) Transcript_24026:142-693(+)
MPALSPTMSEGKITEWVVKEGDKVDVGDVVCDVQTDKATVGFESQEEGYLGKILVPEGSVCAIGSLIGVMVEEEEEIAQLDIDELTRLAAAGSDASTPEPATSAPVETPAATPAQPPSVSSEDYEAQLHAQLESAIHVSPSATFYLRKHKLLPKDVEATGPKGMLTKGDVLGHVEKYGANPAP